MKTVLRRSFTIADAMILLAATAAALALVRSKAIDLSLPPTAEGLRYVNLIIWRATQASIPFLMTWTPAVLILNLMQPRPGLRRLFRRPGVVACGAATLAMVIELIPFLVFATSFGVEAAIEKGYLVRMDRMVATYGRNVPFSIEGAWATLALGGLWRREPTWIDRLGTTVGIAWIAGQVIEQCCIFFIAFVF